MPETRFDPDTSDVNDDPEYVKRMQHPGPGTNLSWAPDGEANLAKQLAMLEIDHEMMTAWLVTMEKLIEKALPDKEFTAERMTRLKLWQRERKRRQFNLHYQYDPRRRRQEKVEKDVKAQLVRSRARLQALSDRMDARPLDSRSVRRPAEAEETTKAPAARPRSQRPLTPRVAGVETQLVTDPNPRREGLIRMIAGDTGIPDPVNAPESRIRDFYRGVGAEVTMINFMLDDLHGRTRK